MPKKYPPQKFPGGKLIRDKIPEISKARGDDMVISMEINDIHIYLKRKLVEEAKEVVEANHEEDFIEEMADLVTVMDCLLEEYGVHWDQVRSVADQKIEEKGSFRYGYVLWEIL